VAPLAQPPSIVEQSRGELAELANRQIHCLAFRRSVVDARPNLVVAAARAIAAAEKSIHASQKETVDLLARTFPARDRRELETIVRLYEPAIPDLPDVHAEDLAPALALFPDHLPKPDLSTIDLEPYIAKGLRAELAKPPVEEGARRARWIVTAVAALCVAGALIAVRMGRKKRDSA
jgi:ABC-type nitrate/sulfonate/bicarbonate transport system substrate-binding protein